MIVWVWLGVEARRRWRSLLVLTLLVAISVATVLTAVAGARRGDTAIERLLATTLPADGVVVPTDPGVDWDSVRALPEVAALGLVAPPLVQVDGVPGAMVSGVPIGPDVLWTVERAAVLDGRLPDPARADEVVVTPEFLRRHGRAVGDPVTLRLFAPETADRVLGGQDAAPDGPAVPARIVGVVRSFSISDAPGTPGLLVPSPGLFDRYAPHLMGATNAGAASVTAFVRLAGGEAAMPAFRAGLAEVTRRTDVDVWPLGESAGRGQLTMRFQAAFLFAIGIAALAAAAVLVGQAIARHTAMTVADLRPLRAAGPGHRATRFPIAHVLRTE